MVGEAAARHARPRVVDESNSTAFRIGARRDIVGKLHSMDQCSICLGDRHQSRAGQMAGGTGASRIVRVCDRRGGFPHPLDFGFPRAYGRVTALAPSRPVRSTTRSAGSDRRPDVGDCRYPGCLTVCSGAVVSEQLILDAGTPGARGLPRLRGRHQPRPLLHRHPHFGVRGRQPRRVVRGQLRRLRGGQEAPPGRGRGRAARYQVQALRAVRIWVRWVSPAGSPGLMCPG
jgi:hypothetical protein